MDDFLVVSFSLVGLVFILFFCKTVTTFLHEFGHAIPALLLTKEVVHIYIGTYNANTKNFIFNIGRLQLFLRKNLLTWWMKGMCHPQQKEISINRQIIYVLCGPLTSSLIAAICSFFAFQFDLDGLPRVILILFVITSFLDLIQNLSPNDRKIHISNGRTTYNDGKSLKLLLEYKRLPKEYHVAQDLYVENDFEEASKLLADLLAKGNKSLSVYRLSLYCNSQLKNFLVAKSNVDFILKSGKENSDDFIAAGYIYDQLGEIEKSVEFYIEGIYQNSENIVGLNNLGYGYLKLNQFELAIPYLKKAHFLNPEFSYVLNNLAWAKIKTNDLEGGLDDIKKSLALKSDDSAYAYRSLGLYYFEKKDFKAALDNLKKAKQLDAETYLIDDLIANAETELVIS